MNPFPRVSSDAAPASAFSGLWLPIVTPFVDGRVDHEALAALTRRLAPAGLAGIVVCGSTGEAAALDDDEQRACARTVARHAGALPLVVGVGEHRLEQARARVRAWSALARDELPSLRGLLVSAPHYVRPAQDGLRAWFETLADDSALPILVYDIPYRTGAVLARDTLLALAAHPNIQGVKDCGGDAAKTQALITDGRLAMLAGEDLNLFTHLALGGAGAVTASLHVHTQRFVGVAEALARGDLAEARRQWRPLVPLIEALFAEPNPAGLKCLLARRGWTRAESRAPMTAASPALRERLAALDAALSA